MFAMSGEGYREAKEYLISVGKFEKVKDYDGFSIVHYANWLKGQEHE
ncbi:MAG: hypothetical protein OQK78_10355 [Gammaproteobacteria bacterium]|nr:hypothetical protein [Gammaproteobacteria bacterium]MCW8888965.1 hypothetical protein [Gammaproteobacteria bacterium]MCW8982488.1 hypothetical protein [Gammaproteobacteria bacterium]